MAIWIMRDMTSRRASSIGPVSPAQQAAGKVVKAVFQRQGAEAWGHSVADLLQELSGTRGEASRLRYAALELDKAYIPTRYPNAHPSGAPRLRYTRVEAERLVKHAEDVVAFCEALLSGT